MTSFFNQDNSSEPSPSNFLEYSQNTVNEVKSDMVTGMPWWDQDTMMLDHLPPPADTDYGVGSTSQSLDSCFCGQLNPDLLSTMEGQVVEGKATNGETPSTPSTPRPKSQSLWVFLLCLIPHRSGKRPRLILGTNSVTLVLEDPDPDTLKYVIESLFNARIKVKMEAS